MQPAIVKAVLWKLSDGSLKFMLPLSLACPWSRIYAVRWDLKRSAEMKASGLFPSSGESWPCQWSACQDSRERGPRWNNKGAIATKRRVDVVMATTLHVWSLFLIPSSQRTRGRADFILRHMKDFYEATVKEWWLKYHIRGYGIIPFRSNRSPEHWKRRSASQCSCLLRLCYPLARRGALMRLHAVTIADRAIACLRVPRVSHAKNVTQLLGSY